MHVRGLLSIIPFNVTFHISLMLLITFIIILDVFSSAYLILFLCLLLHSLLQSLFSSLNHLYTMSTIPLYPYVSQRRAGYSWLFLHPSLLYHLYPVTFSSGFVGVDIFFVISGYVITSSLRSQYLSFSDFI